MNILYAEFQARSHSFFRWWTVPEPLLEERARQADVVELTSDAEGS